MIRPIKKRLPKISKETKIRAKELRREMTLAERLVWSRIKAKQLDVKFLRQRPVCEYICDFVSFEVGLVVEVDGAQHYEKDGKAYDKNRTLYLRSLGFEVLRFNNVEVMQNLEGVLNLIYEEVGRALSYNKEDGKD